MVTKKKTSMHVKAYVSSVSKRPQYGYLFSTQIKSARFSTNTATQQLQRLYVCAGIAGATSQCGRRTWLTTLSQNGVSVFAKGLALRLEC